MGKRWLVMIVIIALIGAVFVGGYKYLAKTEEAQRALGPKVAKKYKEKMQDLFSVMSPGGGVFFACGEKGVFVSSHDGGDSWQVSKPLVREENLASVYFLNEKEGWVVGSSGTFMHTSDGGKTWKSLDLRTDNFLKKILFINDKKGFIVGEKSSLYYTVDGGVIWTKGLKGITEETYCDPYAFEMFNDIAFAPDHVTGFIVGELGLVLKTEDGGKTWVAKKLPTTVNFNSVAVFNKNIAMIGGQEGLLFVTHDGGNTWKKNPIYIGASNTPVKEQIFKVALVPFGEGGYDLTDPRAWHLYVLGSYGLAINSYDFGKNWRVVTMNQDLGYRWLYDISYTGGERACMVGEYGVVFRTKDKGLLWSRIYY